MGLREVSASEPFVPTGREFDDGDLPQRQPAERSSFQEEVRAKADARRIHDFVLEVSPAVDVEPFER